MGDLDLRLVGVNHTSASVEVREKLAVPPGELPATLQALARRDGVRECYILSTCNRVELLVRTDGRMREPCPVASFLGEHFGLNGSDVERFSYRLEDEEGVSHLFRVASGLDSMVLGEPQVLGQVKQAYIAARTAGTLGSLLEPLLQRTFAVAKRIRSETGIARNAVSVATAGVQMAEQIFGDLSGRSVLLIGVGKMAELAARHLVGHGVSRVVVTSRDFSHALSMAEKFGGEPVRFEDHGAALAEADVVISSTAAPHAVIRKQRVEEAMKARRGRPLLLVDIAVPRDVEPEVNELDNVYLFNIDDLQDLVDANRSGRRREAEAAERMVERESAVFLRRTRAAELGPTIAELRARAEEIRVSELQRARRKLGPLTPGQEEKIEALSRSLVNKLLHQPIRELKRSAEERGQSAAAELARRLFDLRADGEGSRDAGSAEDAGGVRGAADGTRRRLPKQERSGGGE